MEESKYGNKAQYMYAIMNTKYMYTKHRVF